MRSIKTEYKAGFESGKLHDESDPLCRVNIRKMDHALVVKGQHDPVYHYWLGYKDGLLDLPSRLGDNRQCQSIQSSKTTS